jgi:ribosome biogenesis protein Nip4
MIKPINDFVTRFGTKISLDQTRVMKKQDRYFLLDENLKKLASKDFFYAGTYLGKVKHGRFFPSFNLLDIITQKKANRVIVDKKTEWLFICGRDVFKQGITKAIGSTKKNGYTLVLNLHGECLGYGRILSNLNGKREGPVIKNSLDIGDFLRRER